MTVFYIDAKSKIVLHPDALKLCPEIGVIKEDQQLFIILAFDYDSPYRLFPEADRIRRASVHVWGEMREGILDKQLMKNAVEAYKSLQYSPDMELIRAYEKKINSLQNKLETEDAPTVIKNILGSVSELKSAIRELQTQVYDSVFAKGKLQGGATRSWLEEMMTNKEYYNNVIKKK